MTTLRIDDIIASPKAEKKFHLHDDILSPQKRPRHGLRLRRNAGRDRCEHYAGRCAAMMRMLPSDAVISGLGLPADRRAASRTSLDARALRAFRQFSEALVTR